MKTVAEAAQLMDLKKPGWYKAVNTQTLNMTDPYFCILGQAFGTYGDGKVFIGLGNADFREISAFNLQSEKERWIFEINARIQNDMVNKVNDKQPTTKPCVLYQIAENGNWAGEGFINIGDGLELNTAISVAKTYCNNNGIERFIIVPFNDKPYTYEKNGWVEVR